MNEMNIRMIAIYAMFTQGLRKVYAITKVFLSLITFCYATKKFCCAMLRNRPAPLYNFLRNFAHGADAMWSICSSPAKQPYPSHFPSPLNSPYITPSPISHPTSNPTTPHSNFLQISQLNSQTNFQKTLAFQKILLYNALVKVKTITN
jgi:hypothetical protein